MNKYIRNIGYKVPFEFCKECKAFSPYEMRKTCLKDDGCKEAVRLYKMYDTMINAADAIEHLKEIVAHQQDEIDRKDKALQAWVNTWEQTKGKLIDRICENCETPPDVRLRVCGECPIIQPIREVFDEQQS